MKLNNTTYRQATKEDDKTLRNILKENIMDSWVQISMEREPSYFEGESLMGKSYSMIVHKKESVVGMYGCSYLPVYLNLKPESVGYLGGLRLDKKYRNSFGYIKNGFKALSSIIPNHATVPFYFTSIASGNVKAKRLLEANLKGMPTYTKVGEMMSLVFSTRVGEFKNLLVRATKDDILKIVAFYNQEALKYQFSPHLTTKWLESFAIDNFWLLKDKNQEIKSCFALWDQREFKQTIIRGYKYHINKIRPLYNLFAKMTKRVELPKIDEELGQIFIAFFAFKDCGDDMVLDILREGAFRAKKMRAKSCVIGLSSQNPITNMLKKRLKANVYCTDIESVVLDGEKQHIFKNLIIQPEIALL